mmetsp:Transcript_8665/g.31980  ORF Transcript_8665/g.31980 Transcript_8665/m.31980 type:complete len:97 (-) Transcript_8665:884-1174(-)
MPSHVVLSHCVPEYNPVQVHVSTLVQYPLTARSVHTAGSISDFPKHFKYSQSDPVWLFVSVQVQLLGEEHVPRLLHTVASSERFELQMGYWHHWPP